METRAIRRLLEMVNTDNIAVAIESSGCGKSTTIHYVALKFALEQEYEIIIVYNPEDMRQLYNPECKQVFVIDDVLSNATLDEYKAKKWLLLNKKIDFNNYQKLFDIAKIRGHDEIVKLILEHYCYSNFGNENDTSPLFKTIRQGVTGMVKVLLENKFDPNICKNNETPLLRASSFCHTEIVKLLLEYYSDPNVCNRDNESHLCVASSNGYAEIVKLLLDHNCDPNLCNNNNESPLFATSSNGKSFSSKIYVRS
ncbi:unnamed protein product [Mytilus edulis]|uniref:Novel STAND NTPase 3 domain-containing protein n=1 Tax=Mytilus edulis TaxID=6550 RepID=A0A8S3UH73_MYTED|nr:unnamed protein product [Mytilus edulis]